MSEWMLLAIESKEKIIELEKENAELRQFEKDIETFDSNTKAWIDSNKRLAKENAELKIQLAEAREVQNKLGEWVARYAHYMRVVDYCGSLEDALEMEQYLYELKEQGDEI